MVFYCRTKIPDDNYGFICRTTKVKITNLTLVEILVLSDYVTYRYL